MQMLLIWSILCLAALIPSLSLFLNQSLGVFVDSFCFCNAAVSLSIQLTHPLSKILFPSFNPRQTRLPLMPENVPLSVSLIPGCLIQDSWQLYKIASVSHGFLIKGTWGDLGALLRTREQKGAWPMQNTEGQYTLSTCSIYSWRTRLCGFFNPLGQFNHQIPNSKYMIGVEFRSVHFCHQDSLHSLLIASTKLIPINNRFVWWFED